jgi:hypothetical protein
MTRFVGAGRWSRGRQLSKPQYSKMKLVKVAYGNDDDKTSFQQPQGLLQAYPYLMGIISPTVRAVRPGQARLPGRLRGGRAGVRAGRTAVSSRVPSHPHLVPIIARDERKPPADSLRRHSASLPVPPRPAGRGVARREGGTKSRPPAHGAGSRDAGIAVDRGKQRLGLPTAGQPTGLSPVPPSSSS